MKILSWILIGVMGAAILLLALNLRERDHFDYGTPCLNPDTEALFLKPVTEVDPYLPPLIPEKVEHGCDTCGPCVHPVELVEAHRMLYVQDRDGWYRLFWAEDDTYAFDDLVYLAEAMRNPTAHSPGGVTELTLRTGPANHAMPTTAHDCAEIPDTFSLLYTLQATEESVENVFIEREGPFGKASIARKLHALSFRYEDLPHAPPPSNYSWLLDDAHSFVELTRRPCGCGKP